MSNFYENLDVLNGALANIDRIRGIRAPRLPKRYKKRYNPFAALTEGDFRCKYRFTKVNMRRLIDLVRPYLDVNNKRGGKISTDLQVLCAIRYWGRNEVRQCL